MEISVENHGFDLPLCNIVARFNSPLYMTVLSHELPLYNMVRSHDSLLYSKAELIKNCKSLREFEANITKILGFCQDLRWSCFVKKTGDNKSCITVSLTKLIFGLRLTFGSITFLIHEVHDRTGNSGKCYHYSFKKQFYLLNLQFCLKRGGENFTLWCLNLGIKIICWL